MKKEIINWAILFVSIFLIFLILLQKRGSALSSGEFYPLRRGIEKNIFYLTIFLTILFGGLLFLRLLIK